MPPVTKITFRTVDGETYWLETHDPDGVTQKISGGVGHIDAYQAADRALKSVWSVKVTQIVSWHL